MKLFFLSFFFLLLSLRVSAQVFPLPEEGSEKEWNLFLKDKNAEVYVKRGECSPYEERNEFYFLKLVNTSGKNISAEWHYRIFYDRTCFTCENDEYFFKISLKKGEILEATCGERLFERLSVFVKYLDHRPNFNNFTGFELGGFKTKITGKE